MDDSKNDEAYNHSLDFVGNASSLVPLTKATLSGRESVGHLITTAGQDTAGIFNYDMEVFSNDEGFKNDLNLVGMTGNR